MDEANKLRVVALEQYQKGYIGFLSGTRPMIKVMKQPNGNYLVREATDSPKSVKGNERTTDPARASSEPEGKPNE